MIDNITVNYDNRDTQCYIKYLCYYSFIIFRNIENLKIIIFYVSTVLIYLLLYITFWNIENLKKDF